MHTFPLALNPVNQIVTPFWLSSSERSVASTDPGRQTACWDTRARKTWKHTPLWKVMLVDIVREIYRWTSICLNWRVDETVSKSGFPRRSYIALLAWVGGRNWLHSPNSSSRFGSIDVGFQNEPSLRAMTPNHTIVANAASWMQNSAHQDCRVLLIIAPWFGISFNQH